MKKVLLGIFLGFVLLIGGCVGVVGLIGIGMTGDLDDEIDSTVLEEEDSVETKEIIEDLEEESERDEEIEEEIEEETEEDTLKKEVGETFSFAEFTIIVKNYEIEDELLRINFDFRNDSFVSEYGGLPAISALIMQPYQDGLPLEEVSNQWKDDLGSNRGIYYRHKIGIQSGQYYEYKLNDKESPVEVKVSSMLYDFELDKGYTFTIN